ncbi:MAG: alpha/beta fold hydrolase [Deltaproteobacteria bacterium]|nr:alpha/beta fold hydrolase [Deltaproteobacteria bacterium]
MTFNPPQAVFFLLSHASGSGHHYAEVFPNLGEQTILAPLDLPGHGKRREEPLLYDLNAIGKDLGAKAAQILGQRQDYYVFGHSMGALNAYVMIENLLERGWGQPKRFFVSSYSVPGWHPIPPGMSDLPDVKMWLESGQRFGKLNQKALPTPEQIELFSSVYRADLKAVERYLPQRKLFLTVPITVFFAENDMVDYELVRAWEAFTSYPLEIIEVPGGHFHPLENSPYLEKLLIERLG